MKNDKIDQKEMGIIQTLQNSTSTRTLALGIYIFIPYLKLNTLKERFFLLLAGK